MPLEIKEMVIKINVNDGGGSASAGGKISQSSPQPADKKAIVAECLEQMADLLKRKKER